MKFEFLPLKDSGLDNPKNETLVGFENVVLSYPYAYSSEIPMPKFDDNGNMNETLKVIPKLDNELCISVQAVFENTSSQIDNIVACCTGIDVVICVDINGMCYGIGSNKHCKLANSDIQFYHDWVKIPTPTGIRINSIGAGVDFIMFMADDYEIYLRGDISKGQAGSDALKDNNGNYYTTYPFVVDNTVDISVGAYSLLFLKSDIGLLYDGYFVGSASIDEIKKGIIMCAKRVTELELCQHVTCGVVGMKDDPELDSILKLSSMLAAKAYNGDQYVKTDFVRLLSLVCG